MDVTSKHPNTPTHSYQPQAPAPLAYSNLVLRTAQYNENVWEDVLKVLIGETLLIDSMGGPQVRACVRDAGDVLMRACFDPISPRGRPNAPNQPQTNPIM